MSSSQQRSQQQTQQQTQPQTQPQTQQKSTRIRGPKYTMEEDESLCRNYVFHTKDDINGCSQQKSTFYGKILQNFGEETGNKHNRDADGLCHRFCTIATAVSEYVSLITQMWNNRNSGEGEPDVERRCREEWQRTHKGASFQFERHFTILRVLNKFNPYLLDGLQVPTRSPHGPVSQDFQNGGPSSSPDGTPGSQDHLNSNLNVNNNCKRRRGGGVKAAKAARDAAQKAAAEGGSSEFNYDDYKEMEKEMEKQRVIQRSRALENQQKSLLSREQHYRDYKLNKLLIMDTGKMNEIQYGIWKSQIEKIQADQVQAEQAQAQPTVNVVDDEDDGSEEDFSLAKP